MFSKRLGLALHALMGKKDHLLISAGASLGKPTSPPIPATKLDANRGGLAKRTQDWNWRVKTLDDLTGDPETLALLALWRQARSEGPSCQDGIAPLSARRKWTRDIWWLARAQWKDGESLSQAMAMGEACKEWHEGLGVGMSVELADGLASVANSAIWKPECVAWAISMREALGPLGPASEKEAMDFADTLCLSVTQMAAQLIREKESAPWHLALMDLNGRWGMPDAAIGPDGILRAKAKILRHLDGEALAHVDFTWRKVILARLNSEYLVKKASADFGVDFIRMLTTAWERSDLEAELPLHAEEAPKERRREAL